MYKHLTDWMIKLNDQVLMCWTTHNLVPKLDSGTT